MVLLGFTLLYSPIQSMGCGKVYSTPFSYMYNIGGWRMSLSSNTGCSLWSDQLHTLEPIIEVKISCDTGKWLECANWYSGFHPPLKGTTTGKSSEDVGRFTKLECWHCWIGQQFFRPVEEKEINTLTETVQQGIKETVDKGSDSSHEINDG